MREMIGFIGRTIPRQILFHLKTNKKRQFWNGDLPDVDVMVAGSFHLAPQQKRVFGLTSLFVFFLFDGDVLNLESV